MLLLFSYGLGLSSSGQLCGGRYHVLMLECKQNIFSLVLEPGVFDRPKGLSVLVSMNVFSDRLCGEYLKASINKKIL